MDPISTAIAAQGAITLAMQVKNSMTKAAAFTQVSSLIDVSQVARVEPLVMVDADCMNVEFLPDVMQSVQSIFSGYYLQAIDIFGNIGNISIAEKLAPLNPNRGFTMLSHSDWRMSTESYKHRLPTTQNTLAITLEASKVEVSTSENANKTMMEVTNLSVGKLYDVTLCGEKNEKAHVKIAIRLMVNSLPTSVMVGLFTFKDQFDMDFKERYHAWRSGRLSFVKDLILCRDIIEKHRTALINDKTGVYSEIVNRENKNFLSGLKSGNPSLATASNIAVLSSDTVAQIEQKINGKLSNFKTRQHIFDNTNLMIMAVIDKAWNRVTFYHRGINQFSTMSDRDLKNASKGDSGSAVTDIMKAFLAGNSPQM